MRNLILVSGLFLAGSLLPSRICYAAGGASSRSLDYTTVGSTVATAAGTLYDMHISTGAGLAGTACFDDLAVERLVYSSTGALWVVTVSSISADNTIARAGPDSRPTMPIEFTRNLFCVQNGTGHRTQILFRSP